MAAFAVGVLFLAFYGRNTSPPTPYAYRCSKNMRPHGDSGSMLQVHGAHRVAWQGYLLHSAACRAITLSRGGYLGLARTRPDLASSSGGLAGLSARKKSSAERA